MNGTLNSIKRISTELVPLIETSQKLINLYNKNAEDENLKEINELIEEKSEEKGREIRFLIEELESMTKLYLALTTPFEFDEDEDLEDENLIELERLYADYKQLVSIGPDPEQGYDRSYEAEKSRIEDQIDSLESELLNENPFEN